MASLLHQLLKCVTLPTWVHPSHSDFLIANLHSDHDTPRILSGGIFTFSYGSLLYIRRAHMDHVMINVTARLAINRRMPTLMTATITCATITGPQGIELNAHAFIPFDSARIEPVSSQQSETKSQCLAQICVSARTVCRCCETFVKI